MRQEELRPAVYHRLHRLVPFVSHPAVRAGWRWALRAAVVLYFAFVLLVLGLRYLILPNIENYRPEIERAARRGARPVGRHRWHRGELGRTQSRSRPLRRAHRRRPGPARAGLLARRERPVVVLAAATCSCACACCASMNRHCTCGATATVASSSPASPSPRTTAMAASSTGCWRRSRFASMAPRCSGRTPDATPRRWSSKNVNLALDNDGRRHRFGLTALPPAELASAIDLRGDFRGRDLESAASWKGQAFVQVDHVDLAAWRAWIDYPFALPHGRGAIRAWAGFAAGTLQELTADLSLASVNLRLAKNLPELALDRLSGRIAAQFSARRRAARRPPRRTPRAVAGGAGGCRQRSRRGIPATRARARTAHRADRFPPRVAAGKAAERVAARQRDRQRGRPRCPRRTRRLPAARPAIAPPARRVCTARPHWRTARQLAGQRRGVAGLLAAGLVRESGVAAGTPVPRRQRPFGFARRQREGRCRATAFAAGACRAAAGLSRVGDRPRDTERAGEVEDQPRASSRPNCRASSSPAPTPPVRRRGRTAATPRDRAAST
jgi:hypothetical protein